MCENCAFSREDGCAALMIKQCILGKPCSFFKTRKGLEEGRAKAAARIATLPAEEQAYIRGKYYGKKPIGN